VKTSLFAKLNVLHQAKFLISFYLDWFRKLQSYGETHQKGKLFFRDCDVS